MDGSIAPPDLEELIARDPNRFLIEMERELVAEHGLAMFIRLGWHAIEGSEENYRSNWHIDAICDHLMGVSQGHIKRLGIAVPPRHMKSISCAVMWPAWDWIDAASRRFLFASYAHNLSIRDSTKCRRVILSPWYQARWGHRFQLTSDQNTKIKFENDKNGHRIAASVGGQITGDGGDFVLCFPGDEVVLTETGYVEIGRIVTERLCLRVWSYDASSGRVDLKPIIGWHRNPGRAIVRVTLDDGSSFRCTPCHRIWTRRGWVAAAALQSSDVLPRATIPDIHDRFSAYAHSARENTGGFVAEHDLADLSVGEFRKDALHASGTIIGFSDVRRYATPRLALSDLLHRAPFDLKNGGEIGSLEVAFSDLAGGCAGQLGVRALFQKWECPVSLGVFNILRSCAVAEVGEEGIATIPVAVADLLAGRAGPDERKHNDLVNEQLNGFAIAPCIEAGISFSRGSTQQPTRNRHRFAAMSCDAWNAADSPAVGYEVIRESGDRSPILIEQIGHVDETFCLSVADYNTMMCSTGDVIAHNCDDPHNVAEGESEATRTNTTRWWDESMSSRLNDPKTGAFVIIQQRIHELDLLGHVLKKSGEEYTYLCLPAEYEPDHKHIWARDPRTEVGQMLWPEHIGRDQIEALKTSLGQYAYAGQYQQNPSPREGGIFKRGWFDIVATVPEDCIWARGWDFAATEKKITKSDPDWTATALIGWSNASQRWYIRRIQRWREDPHEVERLLVATSEGDPKGTLVRIPQDPAAAGKSVAQRMLVLLAKFSVTAETVSGDKVTRAMAWAGKAAGGLIKLVKDRPDEEPWNEAFLTEIAGFPNFAHDDQVDCVGSAFEVLSNNTFGIMEWARRQAEAVGGQAEAERKMKEAVAAAGPLVYEGNSAGVRQPTMEEYARALAGKKEG